MYQEWDYSAGRPAVPAAAAPAAHGPSGGGVRRSEEGGSYANIVALPSPPRSASPRRHDPPDGASSESRDEDAGGFQRQKRRHNKPRSQGTGTGTVGSTPAHTSRGLGWGKRHSGRLGTPTPCQVLVRYLPRDFPAEELRDYVKELLHDVGVEVQTLWRRSTSAFVVTAARWHFHKLLSEESWDPHIHVKPYFTREERPLITTGASDGGSARISASVTS